MAYKQCKVAYAYGKMMQDAFHSFTPNERELIMTSICQPWT